MAKNEGAVLVLSLMRIQLQNDGRDRSLCSADWRSHPQSQCPAATPSGRPQSWACRRSRGLLSLVARRPSIRRDYVFVASVAVWFHRRYRAPPGLSPLCFDEL